MNKMLTGAVATAAGVALLMGGAGTFAYWNSSIAPVSSTITAGNLKVENSTTSPTGVWTLNTSSGTVIDPSTYKVIPGQTLVYTKKVNVTAVGDALTATLAIGSGSITAANSSNAADVALASLLSSAATSTITASGSGVTANAAPNLGTYTITAGSAGVISREITVTVTLVIPNGGAGAENSAKTGSVNLSGFNVTLTQI